MFSLKILFLFSIPQNTQAEKLKSKSQNIDLAKFTVEEEKVEAEKKVAPAKKQSILNALYGTASYYADKFTGRKMANGVEYDPEKLTAACNVLPLGTVIKVTNLKNGRSVIVEVTDRLHARMTRVVDLSKVAAQKLGYITKGLTKVSVVELSETT